MIKLIASDIDGTLLLNGKRELSQQLFEQIRELKKKNVLFVAASGRQLPNLHRLFEPVQEEIAYIAENGAVIEYQGKIIFKKAIERETGLRILKDIKQKGACEILLSGEATSYLEPKTAEYEEHMKFFVKNNVTVVEDITQVQEAFLKISVYEKDGIEGCADYFKEKWSDEVTVVTSGYKWLDMVHKDVNKGTAMKSLQTLLAIPKEACVAFGDNYNDIEMLDAVKYSYAMDSAQPGVEQNCMRRTDTVEHALKKILQEDMKNG